MSNVGYPFYKAWKANGTAPASGYHLYTYESGTTTPKTTYSDSALTTPNANPIVLDASGQATIFLGSGAYRFDLKTPAGGLINTFDPIQGIGVTISSVDSVAELKSLSIQGDALVNVLGYYTRGDGGGGTFFFDASSAAADNGGTIFIPNSAPAFGRWKRIYSGEINALWFGVKGDASDDTAKIQAAAAFVNSLPLGGTLYFPATATYYGFTSNLTFASKTAVKVDPYAKFASSGYTITFNGKFIKEDLSTCFELTLGTGAVTMAKGSCEQAFPQWWGADASGTGESAAAIQAAINCGLSLVVIPAGTYRISSTITIANKAGFILRGQGMMSTNLAWYGADGGTLMIMRGTWFSRIEHLWLNGNRRGASDANGAGICLSLPCYASGTDTYTVTMNTLYGLNISDCRSNTASIALKIGDTTGTQLDNLTIEKCFISNSYRLSTIQGNVCFFIHFINTMFSVYDGVATGGLPNAVAIDVADRCAQIYFYSCQFVGGGLTIPCPSVAYVRRDNISGSVSFEKCEMESHGRFFVGLDDTAFKNLLPVTMKDCVIGYTGAAYTYTITTTAGSPVATIADTSGFAVGKGVTGTNIPANTTIADILPNGTYPTTTGILLSQNATGSGPITATVLASVIDYRQNGAFIISGGRINASSSADVYFATPGGVGVDGGLVQEIGGSYANISFVIARGSQLNQTTLNGGVNINGKLTVNASSGTVRAVGRMEVGGVLYAEGSEVELTTGLLRLANNKAIEMRNAAATVREVLKLNASDNLEVNKTGDGGLEFYANSVLVGSYSSTGIWTIGASAGTSTHLIKGAIHANKTNSHLLGGGSAVSGVDLTLGSGSTSDASLFRHLAFMHGGNSARSQFCTETATGIVSPISPAVPTAVRIAGLEFPSLLLVNGSDGAGNTFLDLLLSTNSGTPTVVSSATTGGTPRARTYSISSYNLMVTMAAGGTETTYTTNTFWMQMSFR